MLLSLFGSNQPSEEKFWHWFEINKDNLAQIEDLKSEYISKLRIQLKKYNENLTFEISALKKEFIVSADGLKEYFPDVEKLVAAAPNTLEWKVIAFRPRVALKYSLEYQGLDIKSKEVFFQLVKKDDGIDLILFFKEYNEAQRELYIGAGFILLDMALGEYDVATKVRFIDFQRLPEDGNGIYPYTNLPERFDELYKAP